MTNKLFINSIVAAISLWTASSIVSAATQATFSDSWKDASKFDAPDQIYYVSTTGSFSTSISLPLNGLDVSEADTNSMFSLSIGPAGSTLQIISDTLGDAEKFSASKKSATFILTDPNSFANIGSVTVTWSATTITVTGSASEDILGEEQMYAMASSDVATNFTLNSAETGVYYEISLTLDTSDNGGGIFSYDNANVPVTGSDKETEFNPPDGSGPYPLESGSISGAADVTPPVLTVTSPSASEQIKSSVIPLLSGKATDNVAVASVWVVVNNDLNDTVELAAPAFPLASINWETNNFDLSQLPDPGMPGTNELQFYALDTSSNLSSIVTREVFWAQTADMTLQIVPPGSGKITGLTENEPVDLGKGYVVTATPAKGYILENWMDSSGDYLSGSTSFNYIVGEYDGNPNLTASFVPNPYPQFKGTYTGLFFDPVNGATPTNAGYLTVTVTTNGAYSGKVDLGTASHSISGQFTFPTDYAQGGDTTNSAEEVVKVSSELSLGVELELNVDTNLTDPGAGLLTGTISMFSNQLETNYWQVPLTAELSEYVSSTNTVPGIYNIAVPPVGFDSSQGPGGYGYGTATLAAGGAVKLLLTLADGVSPVVSFSSSVAADGTFPFFDLLYGGKGIILGWLQFTNDPLNSADLEGTNVAWAKLPVADKYYTNGFSTLTSPFAGMVLGSRYVAPKTGTNILASVINSVGSPEIPILLDDISPGGIGTDDIAESASYNPQKNVFTVQSPDAPNLKLSLTTSSGAFTGSFNQTLLHGSKVIAFNGLLLPVGAAGYGFFLGTNQDTGSFILGAPGAVVVPAVGSPAGIWPGGSSTGGTTVTGGTISLGGVESFSLMDPSAPPASSSGQ